MNKMNKQFSMDQNMPTLKNLYISLNEGPANLNNPVMMKVRASNDFRKRYSSAEIKRWYDALEKLYSKFGDALQLEKELFIEMESDPDIEIEGGPVADSYGAQLDELDRIKSKISTKISEYESLIQKYKSQLNLLKFK